MPLHNHLPKPARIASLISGCMLLLLGFFLSLQGCKKEDHQQQKAVDLKVVADSLTSPVTLAEPPDGTHRLFIVDQVGKIWIVDANGNKLADPFIDVSSRLVNLQTAYDERGLLGLAFHPDYKNNGRFYLFYTAPPRAGGPAPGVNWNNLTRISEFRVSASNPNVADMGSEKILLEEDHPQLNHDGGTLAFGPDGYLYISIGDGGNKDDVGPGHVTDWYTVNAGGNGQDIDSNLMGNILRIDVNSSGEGKAYGIPGDNPFVGKEGRDEIYAYGFRNPYRFSFDQGGSHQLFAGDAGQSLYEEIDLVTKGGNYGWNVKEGTHCFDTDSDLLERPSCPDVDPLGNKLIDPVIEMVNASNPKGGGIATVIVAGHVYRGSTISSLQGKYIFARFSSSFTTADGKLYWATPGGTGLWNFEPLALKSYPNDLGQYVKGFGQGLDGEVYVTTSGMLGPTGTTGKVLKLVAVD